MHIWRTEESNTKIPSDPGLRSYLSRSRTGGQPILMIAISERNSIRILIQAIGSFLWKAIGGAFEIDTAKRFQKIIRKLFLKNPQTRF